MSKLFENYDLAGLELPNRFVMAPMTRSRALDMVADDLTAEYYAQRAGAGLIVSEGSQISEEGRGYLFTPGIHTQEQVEGWKKTTRAVHEAGGRIFIQMWHVGRVSHTSLQPDNLAPVSSVPIKAQATYSFTYDVNGVPGQVPSSQPRALTIAEIHRITNDYVAAAQNAMDAGFDGVEIHAANGYLFEQFINGGLNQRADVFGGSIENRLRFLLETIDAMVDRIGKDKVGVRISPQGRLFDMHTFPGEKETWLKLAAELTKRDIAYVHISDMGITQEFLKEFRAAYKGTLILACSFDQITAEKALAEGLGDLIAFGRPFISNPDLVERMRNDWPLAAGDRNTFYGGGVEGYTDYPRFDPAA
ncbi:alkene reductase [Pseudomonas sp. NPDC089752]|uniref:alkene reductase n=1 Tax=Pseudomonas sp. NPDC089752 TaxID=3364472 RepID=UPI00380B741B